jgi:hypothetical protein
MGQDKPTQLGPLERASLNHWVHCLPHTRRWIKSKTSPIALYNIHHRQNPFKSIYICHHHYHRWQGELFGSWPSSEDPPDCVRFLFIWISQQYFFLQSKVISLVSNLLTAKLLLALAITVILGFESHGTHDHISLSDGSGPPNLGDKVSVFMFPSDRVAQLYPQAPGSLFVAFYDWQGYGGGILTRLNTRNCIHQHHHHHDHCKTALFEPQPSVEYSARFDNPGNYTILYSLLRISRQ